MTLTFLPTNGFGSTTTVTDGTVATVSVPMDASSGTVALSVEAAGTVVTVVASGVVRAGRLWEAGFGAVAANGTTRFKGLDGVADRLRRLVMVRRAVDSGCVSG